MDKSSERAPVADIDTIRARVDALRCSIDAPPDLVTFRVSRHDGTPHIQVDRLAPHPYAFVVCERGSELERQSTSDLDTLLYWVFDTITFTMASDFELAHRISGEDSRRQLFAKQLALLGALSPDWSARRADHFDATLKRHPFRDDLG